MPDPSPIAALSHDLLLHLDGELRILAANPSCTRVLGFPEPELLGLALTELVHPEERHRVAEQLARAAHDTVELAARMRARDNLYTPLEARCARTPDGGLLFVAREQNQERALRDELAEARRILAAVFECSQDYVLITDEQVTVTHANRVAEGTGGVVGKPMLSFSAPDELAAMEQRCAEVLRTGKTVAYEVKAQWPDGSIFEFNSRLGPVRDGDRNVGIILMTRDITAERRAEAAKRVAEQLSREYMVQLERSNRELERFASVASHDLQEPLRKIQAFSDRLREKFEGELAETGRDYLERIRSAAKRMQDLINDLLMFSRLSARDHSVTRVSLAKVARSVLSDLEVRVEETGGKVHIGELPAIEADPLHMRQLLQNLIGNALKFTRPDTPPVVHISGEVVEDPAGAELGAGPHLRLVVADNGIGIEERHYDRIFGIFERLHGRGRYEGTGVGLAVCRKIVEQHHGSIHLTSVVGQGTTFTILLPLKQPEKKN